MRIAELDTPALLIDLDLMEANIAALMARLRPSGVRVRPHLKTAKSPEIARMLAEAGASGFCVAKLGEAEVMAAAGIDDLLITSELAGAPKLRRLVALHAAHPRVRVVVDSLEGARMLSDALAGASAPLEVLIELDVGQRRCGVAPGEPARALAWEVARLPQLRLAALQPLVAASPMLGEVGLDYVWDEDPAHYPAQRAVLAALLQQAAAEDKVVNLHTKGAEHDVLAMLERFGIRRAIVHWYSGPRDAFEALVAHGCWFTFGVETPRNPLIQALARDVPLDRVLTETDGPEGLRWLTGEAGMPRHLLDVLRALAELRGLSVAELTATIAANWRRLCVGDDRLAPWAGWQ